MTRKNVFRGAALVLAICALATRARASVRVADWARDPATGRFISSAQITVRNDQGAPISLFQDAQLQQQLANPLKADAGGHYAFYAAPGPVTLSVAKGGKTLYQISRLLIDPTGPQTISATADQSSVTIAQLGPDDLLVPNDPNTNRYTCQQSSTCPWHWAYNAYATSMLQFERRDSSGARVDAPWLFAGNRAEQSIIFTYNTFGRAPVGLGDPIVPNLPVLIDLVGGNTADFGNWGIVGLSVDYNAGGIVNSPVGFLLNSEVGANTNADLLVDGTVPAVGSVVMISPNLDNAVRLASQGARFPLVVTSAQGTHVTVAISGTAAVQVQGPVAIGDPLAVSSTLGYAQAMPSAPAVTTLGSAVTAALGPGAGTVQVRIGLVQTP